LYIFHPKKQALLRIFTLTQVDDFVSFFYFITVVGACHPPSKKSTEYGLDAFLSPRKKVLSS